MKKINFLSIAILYTIFLFNTGSIVAQWMPQTSPLGTEILGRMQFVSATEGWIACGNNGSLLHTTDAGTTWTVVTPFPNDNCGNPSDIGLTLSWANPTHGWALKTYTPINDKFENGNADGAVLYQTINAGTNWTKKDFPSLFVKTTYSTADLTGTWQIHGLYIDNPHDKNVFNGWVYGTTTIDANGNSTAIFTNNLGETTTRNSSTPAIVSARGIMSYPNSDMHGFISNDKQTVIFTQTDGSGSYGFFIWQKVNPKSIYTTADLQGNWQLQSIQTNYTNAGVGRGLLVIDANGNSTATTSGPESNENTSSFVITINPSGILSIAGMNIHGFLSPDKQTAFFTQTQENGAYALISLEKQNIETSYSAKDLVGLWQMHSIMGTNPNSSSPAAAWRHSQLTIDPSGNTQVSNAVSNGQTEENSKTSISISSNGIFTGLSPATNTKGFLSSDKSIGIFTQTDATGGYQLGIMQRDLSITGDCGLQVQFADNNIGWASVFNFIYYDFKLYKTVDGGLNWNVINGITNPVGGFYYFVDALNGWMFGASGTSAPGANDILHTTNGGLSWTTQATNIGDPKSIHFSDALHGWIVGKNALVMRTTDGGLNWTNLTNLGLASNANSKAVFAVNSNVCYIGSGIPNTDSKFIISTNNGGNSWDTQSAPFQSDIFCISFWDANTGWISGDFGQIAHYNSNTNTTNPDSPSASISPNPSSDFLNIKGIEGAFQISIYDIGGRCVLNEQTDTGRKIDVQKLANGIYFLKFPSSNKYKVAKFIKY